MNILIIDIDSKIPNLALKKIEKYHRDLGDSIEFAPMMRGWADRVYVSCVFTKNLDLCHEWENDTKVLIGGTGYDLTVKLPQEIEDVNPRINWGFTSRGCIRNCHFCFVPKKEGMTYVVGDIYDIWDGEHWQIVNGKKERKCITIMDNNILSIPSHFKHICSQLRKENLVVDFNQGLDLRLVTNELAQELKTIRHKEYKFSWDMDDSTIVPRLKYVYEKLGRCTIFVICGFLPYEKVLEKFELIKAIGHNGYCMRHENCYNEPRYIELARWVNQHPMFQGMTLEQFREANKTNTKIDNKTDEVVDDWLFSFK